jgi:hypothetical protein
MAHSRILMDACLLTLTHPAVVLDSEIEEFALLWHCLGPGEERDDASSMSSH